VKNMTQEVIDAFRINHEDRCLADSKCQHTNLIKKAKEYERQVQIDMAKDLMERVEVVRNSWLDKPNIREGSQAAFIDLVFGVVIKMLEEIK
jgi:hypothetical protein